MNRQKELDPKKARRRALRAAQVVTLGLALAGGGCYADHGASTPDADMVVADAGGSDVSAEDTSVPDTLVDSGPDAGDAAPDAMADAEVADAMTDAALCDSSADWEVFTACCDAHDWSFEAGCGVWGPFVPPADGALPAPRSETRLG